MCLKNTKEGSHPQAEERTLETPVCELLTLRSSFYNDGHQLLLSKLLVCVFSSHTPTEPISANFPHFHTTSQNQHASKDEQRGLSSQLKDWGGQQAEEGDTLYLQLFNLETLCYHKVI